MYFRFPSISESSQEEICKEVFDTDNWTIASIETIDSVNAICRPEVKQNMQMRWQWNVICTEAEQLKSDLTEEVKFTKCYDNYTDQFSDMLPEYKDMSDGHPRLINEVKD